MSTHKHFDKICCVVLVLTLILTILFMNAEAFGVQKESAKMEYENKIFDTSMVHTLNIVMDDWDVFIDNCQSEEYYDCTIVIDDEIYRNVAIRGKGNTSLSQVSSYGNDRYSFKIEFDHYDSANTYYGLDKLCLNNIIQDNTYMKDYLTYQMMAEMGVAAPLCSYVYITVNGEDWGLYLAVEAVEDSFLQRNYGNEGGELYKPDSMSFGGGRGNGKDFNMNDLPGFGGDKQGWDDREQVPGFGSLGMGSSDVKLQYSDDDFDNYSNIFNNAKTDITDADKTRLIEALKKLSSGEDLANTVDIEKVIRYFVVHNFVVNGDSYTGSMIHNYYLYENDGQMQMIPWDYNLAFGTFQGGEDATSTINSPIDSPVSGDISDRPMIAWIFDNEEYTELYHEVLSEFILEYFESGYFENTIDAVIDMIAPYVEKDPTKFCTYEEFEKGSVTLKEFCLLRAESIRGQLEGGIGVTSDTQDSSTFVNAKHLQINDMGSMGNSMGRNAIGGNENQMNENTNPMEGDMPQMPDDREGMKEGMQAFPDGRPEINMDRNNDNRVPPNFEGNMSNFTGDQLLSEHANEFNSKNLTLLAACVVILATGLFVATIFTRRKNRTV